MFLLLLQSSVSGGRKREREEGRKGEGGEEKEGGIPSRPPVNFTVMALSIYFPKSRIFSFLGRSLLDVWAPRPPPSWPPISRYH